MLEERSRLADDVVVLLAAADVVVLLAAALDDDDEDELVLARSRLVVVVAVVVELDCPSYPDTKKKTDMMIINQANVAMNLVMLFPTPFRLRATRTV